MAVHTFLHSLFLILKPRAMWAVLEENRVILAAYTVRLLSLPFLGVGKISAFVSSFYKGYLNFTYKMAITV